MAIEQAQIQNALVFRDTDYPHRWYDAIGPGVAKYLQEFVALPADDTTTDPDEFVDTVVEVGGTSSAVLGDVAGGALVITCAGNDDDGIQLQLGNANSGEFVALTSGNHCYFGIEFALNDADQVEILAGLAVTDDTLLAGATDGMYFRSLDQVATLHFVTEKDSLESTTTVGTLTDGAYVTAEFLYDGHDVAAYVNGVEMVRSDDGSSTFPDDELLRLSLAVLSGEATANTCTVKWMRVIHLTG